VTRPRRAYVLGRYRPGRPIEEVAREAASVLRAGGWLVKRRVVKGKSELRRQAARAAARGVDLVVVVGGDGAVGQVATKLVGTGVALGIVPTGTGNLFARNIGIPDDRRKAIDALVHGEVRMVDVGMVHVGSKRLAFTVACGIGFDADVMRATSRREKLHWGQLAYLANALRQSGSLRNVPHRLVLDGNEIELDAAQVFIANVGRMLPHVEPRLPIEPDDGLLDVIAILASGPLPALLASWEAVRQDALGMSGGGHVYRAQAREIRIETTPARLVEVDGSAAGRTPIEASIVARGLRVMVPSA
jgi:diacylglycerol kinase (ATP)